MVHLTKFSSLPTRIASKNFFVSGASSSEPNEPLPPGSAPNIENASSSQRSILIQPVRMEAAAMCFAFTVHFVSLYISLSRCLLSFSRRACIVHLAAARWRSQSRHASLSSPFQHHHHQRVRRRHHDDHFQQHCRLAHFIQVGYKQQPDDVRLNYSKRACSQGWIR